MYIFLANFETRHKIQKEKKYTVPAWIFLHVYILRVDGLRKLFSLT